MASDLGFVPDSAKAHPHELPSQRVGDTAPKGRFAHAGRTHQAQDRSLEATNEREYRDVVQDPFLHLGEPIVRFIQHDLGVADVEVVLGAAPPRERENPVEIGADHRRLRGHRIQPPQPRQLPLCALPSRLGKVDLGEGTVELDPFVSCLCPQLSVNGLELFVQVQLSTVDVQLLLDLLVQLLLDT